MTPEPDPNFKTEKIQVQIPQIIFLESTTNCQDIQVNDLRQISKIMRVRYLVFLLAVLGEQSLGPELLSAVLTAAGPCGDLTAAGSHRSSPFHRAWLWHTF